jgi:hypothetical protein
MTMDHTVDGRPVSKTNAPDRLTSDSIQQADVRTLLDCGYDVEVSDDGGRVSVTPGSTLDRIDDLRFVVNTMAAHGFEKATAGPAGAVFEESK